MELTLDYDYYHNTFKGDLDEETFGKMLPKAIDQVLLLVNRPLPNEMTDGLKKALCYAIDYEYGVYSGDAGLTSETHGDYSWTRSHSATAIQGNQKRSVILRFLIREGVYDPRIRVTGKCLC